MQRERKGRPKCLIIVSRMTRIVKRNVNDLLFCNEGRRSKCGCKKEEDIFDLFKPFGCRTGPASPLTAPSSGIKHELPPGPGSIGAFHP